MKFFTKLVVASSLLLFIITNAMATEVENDIDVVIKQYFGLKYESLHTLDVKDFSHLLDNNVRAQDFFKDETDKIEIEIANAKKNALRYLEYEYFVKYESVTISQNPEIATVTLTEGHDVVFEVHPDTVSKMRGLKHTILLRNTENGWKIIIDIYEDELKKFLNKTKFKKKQAIEQIQKKSFVGETDTDSGLLDAPSDQTENYRAGTFHSYDKSDAVSYAHTWAYDRNSAYGDFSNMGGDCTNFCSQVIRAGGAPMDSGGSYTWYYYGYSSRSPSWTGVNQLYSYLAANWYTGPAGSVTSISGVQTGDIVQLDFDGDNSYDHSVVVVSKVYENGAYNIKIAAHSTDRDNYPLSSYSWSKKIRYIHIDGYYD